MGKKVVPAQILWKWCQKEAKRKGKRLVKFSLQMAFKKGTCKRRECGWKWRRKKLSLQLSRCRKQNGGRKTTATWVFNLGSSGCGPHGPQTFQGLELTLVGPVWKRQRRRKWSLKNLVFKNYIFLMIFNFWNLCTDLGLEKTVLSFFSWKTRFMDFKRKQSKHESYWDQNNKFKNFEIPIFHKSNKSNKSNSHTNTWHTGHPEPGQTKLNTLKIPQCYPKV